MLLTTAEVAKALRVSRQRVLQFVNAGRLVPEQSVTGPSRVTLHLFTNEEIARFRRERSRKAG